jgi:hypothetical protein
MHIAHYAFAGSVGLCIWVVYYPNTVVHYKLHHSRAMLLFRSLICVIHHHLGFVVFPNIDFLICAKRFKELN